MIGPQVVSKLASQEKSEALECLMFLKNRIGQIKRRGCEYGRKQRAHTGTEDARSPTVAIEALMLSCTLDANEQRDVATVNIPGAFMQAYMDDEVVHLRPH